LVKIKELIPAVLPIFCGEPHHKRIFPPIRARDCFQKKIVVSGRNNKALCLGDAGNLQNKESGFAVFAVGL